MEPTVVTFEEDVIPEAILRAANKDLPIRGRVRRKGQPKVAIRSETGEIVGFLCPHKGAYGWRLGPIFVMPEHRSRGLARAAVLRWRHLGLHHFVPISAPASHAMHRSMGFVPSGRGSATGTWYRLPQVDP